MKESASQNEARRWKLASIFRRFGGSIAVVLILTLMATSINSVSSSNISSISEQVQAKPYDGVTLYRGLFFASGPLVSKVPSLRKAARYFPAEYRSLEPKIIQYIRGKDPGFFDRFAAEVQSGDRARVAKALVSTNRLQKEAVREVTKTSRTSFALQARRTLTRTSEPEAENDANVALDVVAVAEVAVAVLVVAIAFIVFVAQVPAELKGLKFEQYVDEIVRTVPRARTEVLHP